MIIDCGREELLAVLNNRLKMWGLGGGGIKDDAVLKKVLDDQSSVFLTPETRGLLLEAGK